MKTTKISQPVQATREWYETYNPTKQPPRVGSNVK